MKLTDSIAIRIEGTWARHAIAHADSIRVLDPSWGTTSFELADGYAVLQGPGLYVNRALAIGLRGPCDATDLAQLERASVEVGVPSSVDVVPATDAGLVSLLARRGYAKAGEVRVMTMPLDRAPLIGADDRIVVRPISADELTVWQQVSLAAWEHASQTAHRASDAYAAAAHATAGERLMLAFDADDARPVGCASLIVRDSMATLGGMSTLPEERGRGVQRALVAERLRLARDAGCDLATTSAVVGGASERNLLRLGFTGNYLKATWTLS